MSAFSHRTWRSPDGLVLHARDHAGADGAAKLPVICLHGLTRNAADFEAVAPWIAQGGRRVICPDFRGRGRSAWDPTPSRYTPTTYAADILAMMDALGIARAVFVGTSLGGIVTMVLGGMRPFAVAGAALNDIGPSLAPAGLVRIAGYTGRLPSATTWPEASTYARTINEVAFPNYGASEWDAFARRLFEETPDGTVRLAYDPAIANPQAAAESGALFAQLPALFLGLNLGRPVLLIRGAISDLLDETLALEMRATAPGMDYVEVPGVGHAPMLDEPEARRALTAFLAEAE